MKPGRELDALIAEKVMGWKWFSRSDFIRDPSDPGFTPWEKRLYPPGFKCEWHVPPRGVQEMQFDIKPYSTDIAAAWEVVEKMEGVWDICSRARGWVVGLAVRSEGSDKIVYAEGGTAPHAICLAALRAVGYEG